MIAQMLATPGAVVKVGMLALRGATIVFDPAERRAWPIPPGGGPSRR
jgi:hypothetical protein